MRWMIVLVVFCGCASAEERIVIDGWWNVGYAREVCSERARTNGVGCNVDPTPEVRDFEDHLMTHLASDTSCAGISVIRYGGPGTPVSQSMNDTVSSPFWSLSLNFVPGASRQEWEINHSKPGDAHELLVTNHRGEGSTAQIARDVCAIVTGSGAKILH